MRWLLPLFLLVALLTGCEGSTPHGDCVGVIGSRDSALNYKLSIPNTVVGIIFFELVFPPVIVLANETFCPVGRK